MARSPYHSNRDYDGTISPKPYDFVSFPEKPPNPISPAPAGHHQYLGDRLHGTLWLRLQVKTAVHISTGAVVMGRDIGKKQIPLIKAMTQNEDQQLIIQGSSLKGCIRAVYEAITNSTLAVITPKERKKIPKNRRPRRLKDKLCPASRVFGALDWQGLIQLSDAKCKEGKFTVGFLPSLYRPRPEQRRAYYKQGSVAGRKFYYHAVKAIDKGKNKGIPSQQAVKDSVFTTRLQFKNLIPEEMGTLLIVLGQDPQFPLALKVGGGKPIGMGTMTVEVEAVDCISNQEQLRNRYSSYADSESSSLTGEPLTAFIARHVEAAHQSQLIERSQLEELAQILEYPTNRQPPEGMY